HDGKRIEVPISSDGTKKLEVPKEKNQTGSDSGDEFGEYTYEDEELVEAEGYYTKGAIEEPDDLFYNPWEESTSPALYLMNVEKMLMKDDDETETTGAKPIKQRAYRAAPSEHEFIENE
ncbi:911_t:CDS:2, partial [Cetraspora pellucida]